MCTVLVQHTKAAEVKSLIIDYIEKGYFLTDTVKRGINFKMANTLFRVSFVVLC